MVSRGAPSKLANIYKMNDIKARKWLQAIGRATSAVLGDMDEPMEHKLSEIKADQEDVIGYVTTGDLSLRGEGFALGMIPMVQYVALRRQAQWLAQPAVMVKICDLDAMMSRVAYLELLDM
ncbi:hypothetical protein V8B97DRAFT_2026834 [Scleroderma yunnanense]